MIPIIGPAYKRLRRFLSALDRGTRVVRGVALASAVELNRVGPLERNGPTSLTRIAYLFYRWGLFGLALLLSIWAGPTDPVPYFAALLALGGAWLLTLPALCDTMATMDFSHVNFGAQALRGLLAITHSQGVEVPEVPSKGDQTLDAELPRFGVHGLPVAVLDLVTALATRAVLLSSVALLGLSVGSRLAQVRWWPGWSPRAVLYALPAPCTAITGLVDPARAHPCLSGCAETPRPRAAAEPLG